MLIRKCPRCHGSGTVSLAPHLERTLQSVAKGNATAEAIRADGNVGVTVNAISNRLAHLFRLGLVQRHREGKFWHYSIQPKRKTTNVR